MDCFHFDISKYKKTNILYPIQGRKYHRQYAQKSLFLNRLKEVFYRVGTGFLFEIVGQYFHICFRHDLLTMFMFRKNQGRNSYFLGKSTTLLQHLVWYNQYTMSCLTNEPNIDFVEQFNQHCKMKAERMRV